MSDALVLPATHPAPAATPAVRPVVLLILDGFGTRPPAPDNAIANAKMPNWTHLLATSPHTTIDASELRVGLPTGQMGNSEVGHLNIGAGRVVYQDFTRIDHAIATGEFARNPVLGAPRPTRRATRGATLHVLGLLSPGGVHSHERQIAAMVELAAARGVRQDPACTRSSTAATRRRRSAARLARRAWTPRAPRIRARASPRSSAATTPWTATSAGSESRPAYELLVDGRAPFVAGSAAGSARPLPTSAARTTNSSRPPPSPTGRAGRRAWRTATSSCS